MKPPPVTIVCHYGCCPGCQDCYGMGLGCHQDPCRCAEQCTCRWVDEDTDPRWRDTCCRHDDRHDLRRLRHVEPDEDYEPDEFGPGNPCVVCGSPVECGTDTEGRPWIHLRLGGASDD